jgi:hypothetical protein
MALGTKVPKADFMLPVDDFFNPFGDTLNYASGLNTFSFTKSQFPTDGKNSLNRALNAGTFTVAPNSPSNLAGDSGAVPSVPEPTTLALIPIVGAAVMCRRHRRT